MKPGTVPRDWKSAHIAPVFKKGEQYIPETYRPLSLSRRPCKLLERVVVSTVMGYMEQHRILRQEQHGFRRGRSCESQLLGFVVEVPAALKKGCQEDALI